MLLTPLASRRGGPGFLLQGSKICFKELTTGIRHILSGKRFIWFRINDNTPRDPVYNHNLQEGNRASLSRVTIFAKREYYFG